MIIKEYITPAELASFLGVTIPSGGADIAINSAVDYIDQFTGRSFIADDESSVRYFDGNNKSRLLIDDCVEIDEVAIKTSTYDTIYMEVPDEGLTRYIALPNNYEARNRPITEIGVLNTLFFSGLQTVKVTAKWGFSIEPPPAIKQACLILAGGYYLYKGSNTGEVKSEKIGNYSVTYSSPEGWSALTNSIETLRAYKKYPL